MRPSYIYLKKHPKKGKRRKKKYKFSFNKKDDFHKNKHRKSHGY